MTFRFMKDVGAGALIFGAALWAYCVPAGAQDFYQGEDHTLRNVLVFAAGVGVGIGAGMLLAPASGEEIRGSIGDKVQDISDRVRDRFTSETATATGPGLRFSTRRSSCCATSGATRWSRPSAASIRGTSGLLGKRRSRTGNAWTRPENASIQGSISLS